MSQRVSVKSTICSYSFFIWLLFPPSSSSASTSTFSLLPPFVINWTPAAATLIHCTVHRAKANLVKLLKWHYSGQFFSPYLECLDVWQTSRSSSFYPHSRPDKWSLYKTTKLKACRFLFVFATFYLPSPVETRANGECQCSLHRPTVCIVTGSAALFHTAKSSQGNVV